VRVEWVHPSWRDLVIDHLATDSVARERFLRRCSVYGALLALSIAGGASGKRQLPLLTRDSDWDALTDRLHALVPELELGEQIELLDGLAAAAEQSASPELDALADAVLSRVAGDWKDRGRPIALPALEAWIALARQLPTRPPIPTIGLTWAELLPVSTPELSDVASLERFADWLALASLLNGYDRSLLEQLGFPGPARRAIDELIMVLPGARTRVAVEQALRVLEAVTLVIPERAEAADHARRALTSSRGWESTSDNPPPASGPPFERSGHLDVERVLSDL
jgi:hypothetical protein